MDYSHVLVVYLPLWTIWKSAGIVIPNIWKNKIHVPNHQPAIPKDWVIPPFDAQIM